jgi:hypothetical protein
VFIFKNGNRYEGNFEDNSIHGKGILYRGTTEIAGTWFKGKILPKVENELDLNE